MKCRYSSLDVLKSICAFLIISLHMPFPGNIGGLNVIARIAVPIFFLISGFFAYNLDEEIVLNRNKRNIKKNIGLLVALETVYFSTQVCFGNSEKIIKTYFSLLHLALGFGGISGHLWFIRCLIYLEIATIIFRRWLKKSWLHLIVMVWVLDLVLLKYSLLVFGFQISQPLAEFIEKFIGNGFVYYFLGWELKRREYYIKNIQIKISNLAFGALILILIVMNLAEWYLLELNNVNLMPANYCMTAWLAVIIFIYAVRNATYGIGSVFSFIGQNISMYIYYWHPLFLAVIGKAVTVLKIPVYLIMNPISIYIVVALCCTLYVCGINCTPCQGHFEFV